MARLLQSDRRATTKERRAEPSISADRRADRRAKRMISAPIGELPLPQQRCMEARQRLADAPIGAPIIAPNKTPDRRAKYAPNCTALISRNSELARHRRASG